MDRGFRIERAVFAITEIVGVIAFVLGALGVFAFWMELVELVDLAIAGLLLLAGVIMLVAAQFGRVQIASAEDTAAMRGALDRLLVELSGRKQ